MFGPVAAFLAKPLVKYGLIALVVVGLVVGTGLVINHIYKKGETAGAGAVTGAVQKKTIETIDSGRKDKEAADEKTLTTPFNDRVDGLR